MVEEVHRSINVVTYKRTARQWLGKDIPVQANACKNMMSIARQRMSKHTSLITGAVFSVEPVQSGYKEVYGRIEQ
jgi:hypothetical protein